MFKKEALYAYQRRRKSGMGRNTLRWRFFEGIVKGRGFGRADLGGSLEWNVFDAKAGIAIMDGVPFWWLCLSCAWRQDLGKNYQNMPLYGDNCTNAYSSKVANQSMSKSGVSKILEDSIWISVSSILLAFHWKNWAGQLLWSGLIRSISNRCPWFLKMFPFSLFRGVLAFIELQFTIQRWKPLIVASRKLILHVRSQKRNFVHPQPFLRAFFEQQDKFHRAFSKACHGKTFLNFTKLEGIGHFTVTEKKL